MKPNKLRIGDKIGIITPSTPAPVMFQERYQRGLVYLRKLGFDVVEGKCSKLSEGYRSATIMERVEEINDFFRNDEIKAIISTIGGNNSNSLLPYLDYEYFKRNPKIVMGYSDVTALLLGLYTKTGMTTFYGPAIVPSFGEFPEMLPKGREYFENIVLLKKRAPYALEIPHEWTEEMIDWKNPTRAKHMQENDGWKCVREGKTTGKLIGGNMNTMSGFMSSEFFPDLTDCILFIEDSFKDMANQERYLSMLKLAGVFDKIKGLIVGKHEHFKCLDAPFSFEELLLEVIGEKNFPILTNVDIGHTFPSHVFPIGIKVELDATKGCITFLEDAVVE
ncbi:MULTISPECIES: S66 peptidase family protein [unclassified Bacillus (in: firmicutes)]|uniref:S66 family peptidase n=1 Tax=unclassified Bacillus (in: firmicutes) TaxID=185979 RepID=UPI0008E7BE98|nr:MULTISPECIES: S66 peptidase family protein [unclassified Bacillus (in: firmicutes)]SFA87101.1 Muramoyltetrapeptide carboxypeptidase LdcA (peptidoglycan recycling) [Bacillus sp. UNCCL13]SFQ84077.1 Muramoyltetrapeptide carboxypeptidase LdcA (peptidoglycan recycling) [Bacillus sp. cl95]